MKHLNYETATIEEIALHWCNITRQSVSIMRKNHKDGALHAKLEEAYKVYRKHLLMRQIESL